MIDIFSTEIFRAQEIVERVDRQRVEAEEAALRAREKHRKLAEARAVDVAMEEGRRMGYEEGLKQGRMLAQMTEEASYRHQRPSRRSGSMKPDDRGEGDSYGSKNSSSRSSRSSRSHGSVR